MTELWTTLIPLAIATAVLPIQVAITSLMLPVGWGSRQGGCLDRRYDAGAADPVRAVRAPPRTGDGRRCGRDSPAEGVLLLVIAVFLLVSAARKIANQPDEDAPPRWMTMVS